MEHSIQYVRSADGTSIATARGGTGPSLLVLGRFDETIANAWGTYAASFPNDDLILYDRRGFGLSERGKAAEEPEPYLQDVQAIVEGLNLSRFAVLGTLLGSVEAASIAARNPGKVDRLVLRSPVMDLGDWSSLPPVRAALAALEEDWEYFTESFAQLVVGWGNPGGREGAARIRAATTREELRSTFVALAKLDLIAEFPQIRAPTLVVHHPGYFFPDSYSRRIASMIPDCAMGFFPENADFKSEFPLAREFLEQDAAPPESAPASGLQTILFTDLESSTAMTRRFGDDVAQEVLRRHNTVVRAALESHGGQEVKHTGDGIMAVFPSAVRAVEASLQIRRQLSDCVARVRIGLNAGEPIAEDGDFFGTAVQLAARICERAEPGTVLASRVVADLCAGKRLEFREVGEARLEGFESSVALFMVQD